MKFTPRLPDSNVNVSRTHPLVELLWLASGLILIAALAFLVFGLLTDWVATKTPIRIENWLGEVALERFPAKEHPGLQDKLTGLLSSLPEDSPLHQYNFSIHLSDSDEINALALPGGRIVVYSGLLKQVESENELGMVLVHELGHYAHRDHLRGLGRGLGVVIGTLLVFGPGSHASDVVTNMFLTFQMDYSQDQETAADQFGLILLNDHFGHVGGSIDFFVRMAEKRKSRIPYLLASHPHPQVRIDNLQRLIKENHYKIKKTQALVLKP